LNIKAGAQVTLKWTSTNVDYCYASGDWSGNQTTSGELKISATSAKTYTITCYNNYGSASDTVRVNFSATNTNTNSSNSTITDLSALYSKIAYLKAEIARLQSLLASQNQISCAQITKNLYYGIKNDSQVKCLQEFLKSQGLFSANATGNYYSLTYKAVKAFQERYADEILTPLGLTQGTGVVANMTRAKINQFLLKK